MAFLFLPCCRKSKCKLSEELLMENYSIDSSMVHLFEVKGKRFAFDVHSCVFLQVDELMWDALQLATDLQNRKELVRALSSRYGPQTAKPLVDEIDFLAANNLLFSPDLLKEQVLPPPDGVATLCVNLSQACNLHCLYCFADNGTFGEPSALMTIETAKRTVDFFLQHAGKYTDLSLCFFGGEPLLNFNTMRETVDYAKQQAKGPGKNIRYNVTTNGTLLSTPVRRFLATHQFGVIVSIDGSRDVHDAMRPFASGQGSYDTIRRYLDAFQKEHRKNEATWTLRATFTRHHLQFADQVFHLADLGFKDISVEPCVSNDRDLGIGWKELPTLKTEYTNLAERYIQAIKEGKHFSFFHFRVMLDQTKRGTQRLIQCGAGRGYLAVSASGKLYPCHRLVGMEKYQIGSVHEGIKYPERRELFASIHVNSKALCQQCWARYICGGGCHACAIQFNGDILVPYKLECELVKHRIELGAYLYSELSSDQQDQLSIFYDLSTANRPHLSAT